MPGVGLSPPVVLGQQLADARERGEHFKDAWAPALGVALGCDFQSPRECREWRTVFVEMEDTFCAAFERRGRVALLDSEELL